MITSHRLVNLLRSSFRILNPGFISSSRLLSRKFLSCSPCKQSSEQKFLFFTRRVSQLTQGSESTLDSNGNFVQMKGLPFEATTTDIISFFRPLEIEPIEVTIERNRWGRPSGFASVKFKSHRDALKALRNHRNYMGRRYIELSLVMRQTGSLQEKSQVSSASTSDFSTEGHRVTLRGLPYEATTDDIIKFFAPLNIKPSSVHMRYGRLNLPSGVCDCIFESREDAVTALKNHRAYIGKRWIAVILSSDSEPWTSRENLTTDSGGV